MPLYVKKVLLVEKSGDLVECHRFPADRLTQRETLKDRATQLLKSGSRSRSGAFATHIFLSFYAGIARSHRTWTFLILNFMNC